MTQSDLFRTGSLACAIALGLLASGCGDDDDTENPRTLEEPENHRPVAVACPQERASMEPATRGEDEPPLVGCEFDSDCTEGDNGRCTPVNRSSEYECTYDTCFEDADCNGEICACRQAGSIAVNFCMPGNCQTDADCGDDGYCSPSQGDCGSYLGTIGYFCRTLDDECLNDSDCTGDGNSGGPGYCMFSQSADHWICGYSQCVGK
jgi:hypothetical protein